MYVCFIYPLLVLWPLYIIDDFAIFTGNLALVVQIRLPQLPVSEFIRRMAYVIYVACKGSPCNTQSWSSLYC